MPQFCTEEIARARQMCATCDNTLKNSVLDPKTIAFVPTRNATSIP